MDHTLIPYTVTPHTMMPHTVMPRTHTHRHTCTHMLMTQGEDYVLNGSKTWITNGPEADVFIIYAKVGRKEKGNDEERRISTRTQ